MKCLILQHMHLTHSINTILMTITNASRITSQQTYQIFLKKTWWTSVCAKEKCRAIYKRNIFLYCWRTILKCCFVYGWPCFTVLLIVPLPVMLSVKCDSCKNVYRFNWFNFNTLTKVCFIRLALYFYIWNTGFMVAKENWVKYAGLSNTESFRTKERKLLLFWINVRKCKECRRTCTQPNIHWI